MTSTAPLLVTGGTGGLGRPTVSLLTAAGHPVRVLSRTPGPGRVVGDLDSGTGLAAALDGVSTVLHLATSRKKDAAATARLLDACLAASVSHLIYISIVGIERIPFGYYQDKLRCEQLVIDSTIPYTILRATQFHDFLAALLRPQDRLPVAIVPAIPVQPIATAEVAERLVELVTAGPSGRAPDIGGPERLPAAELARQWRLARGRSPRVWSLRLPGQLMAAFAAGHHTTELPGYGRQRFAEYAAQQ